MMWMLIARTTLGGHRCHGQLREGTRMLCSCLRTEKMRPLHHVRKLKTDNDDIGVTSENCKLWWMWEVTIRPARWKRQSSSRVFYFFSSNLNSKYPFQCC